MRHEFNFHKWVLENKIQASRWSCPRSMSEDHHFTVELFLPGEKAQRLAIVLHSTGCDRMMPLTELYKHLLIKGFGVLCFDLDGHGRDSTTIFDQTRLLLPGRPHIIEDVLASLDLPLESMQLFYIGQSLGGCMIVDYLARSTARAAKAALIGMPVTIEFRKISFIKELYSVISPGLWSEMPAFGMQGLVPFPRSMRRRLLPIRVPNQDRRFREIFGYINKVQIEDKIRSCSVPILNVIGSWDSIAQDQKKISDMPHIKTLTLPRETHYSLLYCRRYFETLTDFFLVS